MQSITPDMLQKADLKKKILLTAYDPDKIDENSVYTRKWVQIDLEDLYQQFKERFISEKDKTRVCNCDKCNEYFTKMGRG